MPWWRITVLVEADTPAEATSTLRREGVVTGSHIEYSDGRVVYARIYETASPWKPAHTAPRTGERFVAFDEVTRHTETARWSAEKGKFVNDVGDQEAPFTRWMHQPD